ncbi:MAG: hypothetical protein ABSG93_02180 [Solirubrobacteraceae bacterium]
MSVTSAPPAAGGMPSAAPAPTPAPYGEVCPLCGAPLHPEQEWCLRCGAAARTRLAASPRWKGLITTLAVVVVLSLGVLAAALVKLAGGSTSTAPAITRIVTTAAAAPTPTTTTTTPTAPQPGASTSATSKVATTPPRTTTARGLTGTNAAPAPASGATGKSGAKVESAITKAIRERLRKLGLGKVLPAVGAR